MPEHNEEPKWSSTTKGKAVTWGSILAVVGMFPALIAVNNAYDNYNITQNDKRYYTKVEVDTVFAKKEEVVVLAEVSTLTKSIENAGVHMAKYSQGSTNGFEYCTLVFLIILNIRSFFPGRF